MLALNLKATEALQNVIAFDAGFFEDQAGFRFGAVSNLTVTALGYRFGGSHTNASHTVELFDDSWALLATATLSVTGAHAAQMVYANISPVHLSAGSTNHLVGYDTERFAHDGTKCWAGNYVLEGTTGSFGIAPECEYMGAVVGTHLYGGSHAPLVLWVGPNLQFDPDLPVVPVPLTIELTGSNTVRISWSAADTGGELQTSSDLALPMTPVSTPAMIEGTHKVVELPVSEAQAFFRLIYQASNR